MAVSNKNAGKNKNFHDIFLLHKWYKCIFTIPHQEQELAAVLQNSPGIHKHLQKGRESEIVRDTTRLTSCFHAGIPRIVRDTTRISKCFFNFCVVSQTISCIIWESQLHFISYLSVGVRPLKLCRGEYQYRVYREGCGWVAGAMQLVAALSDHFQSFTQPTLIYNYLAADTIYSASRRVNTAPLIRY